MMLDQQTQPLRFGYTTGACATAATKAALIALITGESQEEVTILIPAGNQVKFTIEEMVISKGQVTAGIMKDGGDDPDATHGALIQSTVSWRKNDRIALDGGKGVGRVTKEGLPIPVGEAAINPVPRQMIEAAAGEILRQYGVGDGVSIMISVPKGEEIAKKTLNGRLGIIGGISILGTRGIVVPFSAEAYTASISLAIKVARKAGCKHVVLTTGGRSEKYAMKQYPYLPQVAFIEMGDFVGFALKECKQQGIKQVSLVGMVGKFSKIAQGKMNVHARKIEINFSFLAQIAKEAGVKETILPDIVRANTAAKVAEIMIRIGNYQFFQLICEYCCQSALAEIGGGLKVETSLYTLSGDFLGKAERQ
ncbi:cobalt-precorrin-5B (C(1))-methyltransferase [Neobacillus sp. OS1-32]|uniref:cobalt-precorrin-5B (C(1))-methyltransferase n=1 Tax=Neobacillus sp. OS1-32 TaxID=3070682 RepID=UPI0027DF0D0C|nr:cobalt-precorrin-5B (C(1))-methyltransferase [Neobacillus sp. OS1-32]WML29138.1 cobalt-precorrin-5B (C(1))-methyltransferase [Neobacillus sp. OS1-32]